MSETNTVVNTVEDVKSMIDFYQDTINDMYSKYKAATNPTCKRLIGNAIVSLKSYTERSYDLAWKKDDNDKYVINICRVGTLEAVFDV